MNDKKNFSLLGHNTFGFNVSCKRFVEYSSTEEAQQLVLSLDDTDKPCSLLAVAVTYS